jgi:2-oxoisovalerate dehydrogenase E1 component
VQVGTPERGALEAQLFDSLCSLTPERAASAPLEPAALADLERLFDVQVASRHCDHAARWLRGQAKGYYTIGSSGHESNAAVAMALRSTDPALLHYRSGGFYLARAGLAG